MDAKITAKVETITPEIAKTMLGENVNNRRISRDNVNLVRPRNSQRRMAVQR